MIEQCQNIVSQARQTARNILAHIKTLDQEIALKNYQVATLKVDFLCRIKQLNIEEQRQFITKIDQLDDEIFKISENKVRLANSLYSKLTNSCEEVNLLFNDLWAKEKSYLYREKQNESDLEIESLIAECKMEENEQFCCCSSKQKIALSDQTMVLCEKEDCSHRWYHISCVGLKADEVPEKWICNMCKLGLVIENDSCESDNTDTR